MNERGDRQMEHVYYKLKNGEFIPKYKVDKAFELIQSLMNGFNILHLDDSDVMAYGDKFDAIKLFREKHDCGLKEAKEAIEFMRGEKV
jgi:hypothetical protein